MTNSAEPHAPLAESFALTAERRAPSWRMAWMLPAALAMLAGLNAALMLIGVPAPVSVLRLAQVHGAILVLGFVATLVSLERSVALRRWWAYSAPALLGIGGVLTLSPFVPLEVGQLVLVAGTAAFTLIYVPLWRRQYDHTQLAQMLGTALACAGVVHWMIDGAFARAVPWLVGFLVLTIAAERIELARISMGPKAGGRLLMFTAALIAAVVLAVPLPDAGAIALGAVLIVLVAWLVVHDIARRTIRASGATRYMAACILAGYVWLAVAAATLLLGWPTTQAAYDTIVHGVFLGYTFSMIMAHATTILPAVLRISLPYRPAFWVPAALLHIALILRIPIGSGLGLRDVWVLGGALGVAALLLFFATAIVSAVLGPKAQHSTLSAHSAHSATRDAARKKR